MVTVSSKCGDNVIQVSLQTVDIVHISTLLRNVMTENVNVVTVINGCSPELITSVTHNSSLCTIC